jgi:5-methylcytosine-specific restriction endonuclease McrA
MADAIVAQPHIITRDDARALGIARCFTGEPCKHGHIDERYVCNNRCVACDYARQVDRLAKRVKQDPDLTAKRKADALRKARAKQDQLRKLRPLTARQAAAESGQSQYFTGKPCSKGHIANRFTASKACVVCRAEAKFPSQAKQREYSAKWRSANLERAAEVLKRFREKHKAVLLERGRAAYAAAPEKGRARTKRWREKNPEGMRAHAMARWALKKNSSGSYTAQDVKDLLKKQKGRCANCRCDTRKKFHVDHIQPLSRGGLNVKANIQILCPTCNMKKHAKDPIDWAQENGRLL